MLGDDPNTVGRPGDRRSPAAGIAIIKVSIRTRDPPIPTHRANTRFAP